MAEEETFPVDLYIYDLTRGFASILSPAILGRPLEGIWHTSVVVYGREFFYGGDGINTCSPGSTQLGAPLKVERLGNTAVPFPLFLDYIQALATSTYTGAAYRLLEHNCNHFSEELAQFLCGAHVPKEVAHQPDLLLTAPQRQQLQALLDQLVPHSTQLPLAEGVRRARDSPEFSALNSQVDRARVESAELEQRRSTLADKLARRQRRRDKKQRRLAHPPGDPAQPTAEMAEGVEVAEALESVPQPAGPSRDPDPRPTQRNPPIVYRDIDGIQEYERLAKELEKVELSPEEKQSLDELQQYLVQSEGSWVLGDEFLLFIGRLLRDEGVSSAVREALVRCLAACALREDVALVLHQDRRHHALLHYAHRLDRLPAAEQRALARLICNLFENVSSSEWLMYISEWEADGRQLSNIRVTTKVSVHCALAEDEELREVGTALLYNMAAKEVKTVRLGHSLPLRALLPASAKAKVFDEVCVELAMALLQVLVGGPGEEHLFRATAALARLAQHSPDVPQLVALVGPSPAAYRGVSPRVDEQIDIIMKYVK